MKKTILSAFVLGLFLASCSSKGTKAETSDAQEVETTETAETVSYTTVEEGSHLEWRASHLGGTGARFGKVSLADADVKVTGSEVTNATINIDMSSLTVENFGDDTDQAEKLRGHLTTGDFFLVDSFATSTFELVSIEAGNEEYNSAVTGNLTIKDQTKSITFMANVEVSEEKVSIQSEDFKVDRREWGLTYHVEGSEGVPVDYLIANDIGFTIHVNVTK